MTLFRIFCVTHRTIHCNTLFPSPVFGCFRYKKQINNTIRRHKAKSPVRISSDNRHDVYSMSSSFTTLAGMSSSQRSRMSSLFAINQKKKGKKYSQKETFPSSHHGISTMRALFTRFASCSVTVLDQGTSTFGNRENNVALDDLVIDCPPPPPRPPTLLPSVTRVST